MQADILRIYLEFVSRMAGNVRVAYSKSQYYNMYKE